MGLNEPRPAHGPKHSRAPLSRDDQQRPEGDDETPRAADASPGEAPEQDLEAFDDVQEASEGALAPDEGEAP